MRVFGCIIVCVRETFINMSYIMDNLINDLNVITGYPFYLYTVRHSILVPDRDIK